MTSRLVIKSGLEASDINAYTEEGARRKFRFHAGGRTFLKSLAAALELPAGSYEIRSNQGGIAVSGEVTLHAEHLYVQLYESCTSEGVSLLYRSCASRTDYCGGQNNFARPSKLRSPEAEAKFLDACRNLIGAAQQRRAIA